MKYKISYVARIEVSLYTLDLLTCFVCSQTFLSCKHSLLTLDRCYTISLFRKTGVKNLRIYNLSPSHSQKSLGAKGVNLRSAFFSISMNKVLVGVYLWIQPNPLSFAFRLRALIFKLDITWYTFSFFPKIPYSWICHLVFHFLVSYVSLPPCRLL